MGRGGRQAGRRERLSGSSRIALRTLRWLYEAMPTLSNALVRLADANEKLLFEGELSRRLSHHMALVASERWLAVELAMLVNERAADVGLPG